MEVSVKNAIATPKPLKEKINLFVTAQEFHHLLVITLNHMYHLQTTTFYQWK
jgi:NRPS condensation-like uncharacterized protein